MRQFAGCIPENSRQIVATIIHAVVGERTDAIEHIKGVGMNNSVTVAHTPSGRFVVRTNVESHLFRYQREAWCFTQLQKTPVLIPRVLGCGVVDGVSYSVAPFIEGSKPISGDVRLRVWKVLGRYAAALNSVRPPTAGSPESAYFPMSWQQQVESDVATIFQDRFWVERKLLSLAQQGKVRSYLAASADIGAAHGVCVFDLTIANAVICNSNYDRIFLLDLEGANIAPVPFYQLACIASDQGPDSAATKAFFEGYAEEGDKEAFQATTDLNRLTLFRLMRATAWARDRFPSLLEANIARTRGVLRGFLN